MAVVTKKTQRKHERNLAIVAEFKIMIKVKGSQRVAIYEHLAACHGVSTSTVGRIVNK